MLNDFDYTGHYTRLEEKISFICGRCDRISPLSSCEKLAATFPRMRFRVIDDCGHAPSIERPIELARLLALEIEEPLNSLLKNRLLRTGDGAPASEQTPSANNP